LPRQVNSEKITPRCAESRDVYAALAYYFDHREDIDKALEESTNWIDELKQKTPSLVKKKLGQGSPDG